MFLKLTELQGNKSQYINIRENLNTFFFETDIKWTTSVNIYEIFRNKLTKICTKIFTEKTLLKGIEKMMNVTRCLCFWIRTLSIEKCQLSPKLLYKFKAVPIETSVGFLRNLIRLF